MTAYTLANNATLRDIGNASIWGVATARSGGDTVDVAGKTLTIDQDSRYGLSGTTSTTWGNLTINASTGGTIHIDGRYVRLIPFTGGSGTITAGTQITCGSATGYVIGIYSSMTTAPVLTGVATGWIKVTGWNQVAFPTSGSYTQAGFTFTISGASLVGFIEVNGDEAATITANRLGTFRVTGEWYALGTTSGTSNQTLQIPNNGLSRYCPGVFIEATAGQADYEFYPNNGVNTTAGTDATRGKVVWIDNTGLVRIGNYGAGTSGYTPTSGLAVVVPNIFFENNTTAARTANVIPNSTIATRYDFTCTGGGVIEIDKGSFAWYGSFTQAYACTITNSGFTDAVLFQEIATPMTLTKVGVGLKATTALLTNPLTMSLCFAGGTITDCRWHRATMAASGSHINVITDIDGFIFVRDKISAGATRANSTTYSINGTRINNCTWTTPTIIQGAMAFTTCKNISVTDTVYCENITGTTGITYSGSVWMVASNSLDCTFSGLTLPITNNHPYTALLQVNAAGCYNIKLRNIGTRSTPLTLGSSNACGLIYALAGGAAANTVKVQRVYCSNTRTGVMTSDNSSKNIIEEHVFGDYADAADVAASLEYYRKARGTSLAYTAQTAVYGTHWSDHFTSTTAGRIAVLANEPTTTTASQVSLTNGAAFTSAGGLYMPTVGMTATFEMPYYALGHTGFSNTALVMAGGTATNYTYEYAIDKNDGNGFSALTSSSYTATTLGTALSGITGIDASKGIKLKIKVTTGTTNTTAITSFYVTTTSSTTAQDYQYPLDTVNVTVTVKDVNTGSAVQNARVRLITTSGGNLVLTGLTNASGVVTGTTSYTSSAISGQVRRATTGYGTLYKPSVVSSSIGTSDLALTVLLIPDE